MWICENGTMKVQNAQGRGKKGGIVRRLCVAWRCHCGLLFPVSGVGCPKFSARGPGSGAECGMKYELPGSMSGNRHGSHYGLSRSRSLGPRGPVASPHGAPALAKCLPSLGLSLSRHANLSPVGSFTPVQSAFGLRFANPYRNFPSCSNPKRLKSHDLQCDFKNEFRVFGSKLGVCTGTKLSIYVNSHVSCLPAVVIAMGRMLMSFNVSAIPVSLSGRLPWSL